MPPVLAVLSILGLALALGYWDAGRGINQRDEPRKAPPKVKRVESVKADLAYIRPLDGKTNVLVPAIDDKVVALAEQVDGKWSLTVGGYPVANLEWVNPDEVTTFKPRAVSPVNPDGARIENVSLSPLGPDVEMTFAIYNGEFRGEIDKEPNPEGYLLLRNNGRPEAKVVRCSGSAIPAECR